MANPSGTVSAPIVRSSFPEFWNKESALGKGVTVLFLGLIGSVFLYTLYRMVSDSSKSHQDREMPNPHFERRREASTFDEKVGCIFRISRDMFRSDSTPAQVAIFDGSGQTLAVRHVTKVDGYADVVCRLPKDRWFDLKIVYPNSSYSTQMQKEFQVQGTGLYRMSSGYPNPQFTSHYENLYQRVWAAGVASSDQEGLVSMDFLIAVRGVYRNRGDGSRSLKFRNDTGVDQIVDISFAVKGKSSEVEALSYVVEAKRVNTLTFDQIILDWTEAYTINTGKHPGLVVPSGFKIQSLSVTPFSLRQV